MIPLNSKNIDQFITDAFSFRKDEEFHLLEISGQYQNQISLAASGKAPGKADLQRIGILANHDESILLRVFRDRTTADYWLFLLANEKVKFEGVLLSTVGSLQYFLVQDDQKIHIPADIDINPIMETLYLTFPDDRATFRVRKLDKSESRLIEFSGGQKIEAEFEQRTDDTVIDSEATIVFTHKSGSVQPTKLMAHHPSLTRMVPVHNDRAVIRLQEEIDGEVQVYLYE